MSVIGLPPPSVSRSATTSWNRVVDPKRLSETWPSDSSPLLVQKEGDPHKPTSKHRTGEAVDFGLNANQCLRNDRDTVDKCFTRCFPQKSYGQEETSPDHFHFQTTPGMGGAKGMKKRPTATKHYKTTPAPKKP